MYHFFPSPIALKTTVLHKMKMLTLAEHKNNLKSYCTELIDMNTMVNTTANTDELVMAFLTQINNHLSDIVCNHFNQIGVKFYMHLDDRPLITKLLESADHLHTVTTSPSLPFTVSTDKSSKVEQNIITLAGLLQSNYSSLKKLTMHISQLENKVKQGFQASKTHKNGKNNGSNTMAPTWKYEAPPRTTEVK